MIERQENVNDAIKTISCLLNAAPWEFGVMSSTKGLLAGNVKIDLPSDIVIDVSLHQDGMLLPHFVADIQQLRTSAAFVLLVEKDTVFKKLALADIVNRLGRECLLITVRLSSVNDHVRNN